MAIMDLRQYFATYKINRRVFCKKVEIHYQHLNNILRKKRNPSTSLALRIETESGGAVTRMELLYPDQKQGGQPP
jgi:hypothetical protein